MVPFLSKECRVPVTIRFSIGAQPYVEDTLMGGYLVDEHLEHDYVLLPKEGQLCYLIVLGRNNLAKGENEEA